MHKYMWCVLWREEGTKHTIAQGTACLHSTVSIFPQALVYIILMYAISMFPQRACIYREPGGR
jgi:hypothetical protein